MRDFPFLAYARHMADTALSDGARSLYEGVERQERLRTGYAREIGKSIKGGEGMKQEAAVKGKKVSFLLETEPGSSVYLAGTFNNWKYKRHPMRDNPDSGHFKATLVLPPGRHEYKFVVNGEWRVDPNCPEWVPNSQGTLNSVIAV